MVVERYIEKAKVLLEALPYILRFRGKIFVIKFGGAAMVKEELKSSFAEDILLLHLIGIHVVVVHGGGPAISRQLERLGVQSNFVQGMRVTDADTMQVVEEVLVGRVNKNIVSLIKKHGGKAVGISGKDGGLITAKKMELPPAPDGTPAGDLGFVGEVAHLNPEILHTLARGGFIPIVAPVGADDQGNTYNINADVAAGQLASSLEAEKLILMTDVEGVKDKDGKIYSRLTAREAEAAIAEGIIGGGMIPKVQCCIKALREGAGKGHIIDGRIPHATLLEIFTDMGIGTEMFLAGRSASAAPSGSTDGGTSS